MVSKRSGGTVSEWKSQAESKRKSQTMSERRS